MIIDLPAPGSREAQVWAEKLLPILNAAFPIATDTNSVTVNAVVDQLLESLWGWYELVEELPKLTKPKF